MCASFSKEELIKIILDLDRENQELREKIKAEQQKRNEKFAKPNAPKKRRMRPGQKLGHVGMTRSVPDHIDEILEQTLCECPACHHSLNESVEVIEQVQEDIIPVHGTIMSLMQTLRLQGRNVSDNLREAFLRHRQGDTKPQLSFMA